MFLICSGHDSAAAGAGRVRAGRPHPMRPNSRRDSDSPIACVRQPGKPSPVRDPSGSAHMGWEANVYVIVRPLTLGRVQHEAKIGPG